jgi:hypothetical protein
MAVFLIVLLGLFSNFYASANQFTEALRLRYPTALECTDPLAEGKGSNLVAMAITPKESFVVLSSYTYTYPDTYTFLEKIVANGDSFVNGRTQVLNTTSQDLFFLSELSMLVFFSFSSSSSSSFLS